MIRRTLFAVLLAVPVTAKVVTKSDEPGILPASGVPPMFVTRDAAKNETFYLLATEEGGVANERVLDFVGDPVAVSGRLERHGDLLLLQVAEDGVRRR